MAATSLPALGPSPPIDGARTVAPRTPRVEIVVVSGDDALLEQVAQALDGESTVRQADGLTEVRAHLRPTVPCVLLLDARSHANLAEVVQDLQSPDGVHIVVVLAPAEQSSEIARAIRGSAAFAVLPVPVVPTQAAAVIEGAREESLARHALIVAPTAAPTPAVVAVAPSAPEPELFIEPAQRAPRVRTQTAGDGPQPKKLYAAVAALGLLVTTIAVLWWRHASTQPPARPLPKPTVVEAPAAAPAVVEPETLQAGSVEELLDSARTAMRERRYTDPEGNNALNYYRSVLAQAPDNGEAREGVQRIAAVLQERVQGALQGRRLEEAARTLAQLQALRPDDPALVPLEATLADARFRKALDEGDVRRAQDILRQATKTGALPPADAARMQAEIDRQQSVAHADELAALVSLRIRQGRLIEPASDSAKYYLAQLRRLPTDTKSVAADATTELQQAYLNKLREAMGKSQRAEADRWKNEARALGVTATELAAIQRDATAQSAVAESRQEASKIAQKLQSRIAEGKLLEPAADSAMYYRDALRGLDPGGSALATGEKELSAKLLDRARTALSQQQVDAARTHAAAARQLGLNLDEVATVERDIASKSAPAAATSAPTPPRLTRTRYVAPDYPKAALAKRLQGEVRLRLSVDAQGRVNDAVVVQSNPAGVFDAAAIAAARQWRFKPWGKKDSTAAATATVDIVFQPQDAQQ